MDKRILIENVSSNGKKLGVKFSEFKSILEGSGEFNDIDIKTKRLLGYMPMTGEYGLLCSLGIDAEDPKEPETADLIMQMGTINKPFSLYFTTSNIRTGKAIDLFRGEIEFMRKKLSDLQSRLIAGISAKEIKPEEGRPTLQMSQRLLGKEYTKQNLPGTFLNKAITTFTGFLTGPGSQAMSFDDFVVSERGQRLIGQLNGLGMSMDVSKFMDIVFSDMDLVEFMRSTDFGSTSMAEMDDIGLSEIQDVNDLDLEVVNDYISGTPYASIEDIEDVMDPYTRIGIFFQLCMLQNPGVIERLGDISSKTDRMSYPEFVSKNKPFETSLRLLFGRDADMSELEEFIEELNSLSMEMINVLWNDNDAKMVKKALFIPVMQAFYVAFMNFTLGRALYEFLTKKKGSVEKERSAAAAAVAAAAAEKTKTLKPADMPNAERAKVISRIFNSAPLQKLLRDNFIYRVGKKGYDEAGVKALKELVYYALGGSTSKVESVKNWDITRNPLDGNYDEHFANIIRDIQTAAEIQPIRKGQGDGKVGPNTKEWFMTRIPNQITKMV